MSALVGRLLDVPTWLVLTVVGLVVFAEDGLLVGSVVPGEAAVLLGGVAARLGGVPLAAMVVTVAVAGGVGDTVGYEVARHAGSRILQLRVVRSRHGDDQVQEMLASPGGAAVLLGRWVGGAVWSVVFVGLGYLAGMSYARVERLVGQTSALVVAGLVVAAFVSWRVRAHGADGSGEPVQERS